MKRAALIPAKSFGRAKSRLGEALSPEERRRLAERCFLGVARASIEAGIFDRVFAATDGAEVASLAAREGLGVILDPAEPLPFHAIVDHALASLATEGYERVTILMADLPEADAESIRATLARGEEIVLVPDASGEGTSALSLPLPAPFSTGFGNHDSARRHRALAESSGLPFIVRELPRLARDIDGPLDLARNPPLYRSIVAR